MQNARTWSYSWVACRGRFRGRRVRFDHDHDHEYDHDPRRTNTESGTGTSSAAPTTGRSGHRPSSAFWKRPAWDFSAFASVSNHSAMSAKPSSRAAFAIDGYISVYS